MANESAGSSGPKTPVEQILLRFNNLVGDNSFYLSFRIVTAFIVFLVVIIALSFISIVSSFAISGKTYVLLVIIITCIFTCLLILKRVQNLFIVNSEMKKRVAQLLAEGLKEKDNIEAEKKDSQIAKLESENETYSAIIDKNKETIKVIKDTINKEKYNRALVLSELFSIHLHSNYIDGAKRRFKEAIIIYHGLAKYNLLEYGKDWVENLENAINLQIDNDIKKIVSEQVKEALDLFGKNKNDQLQVYYDRVKELKKKINPDSKDEAGTSSTPANGATVATPSGTPPTPATGAAAATPSGTPPTPATGATIATPSGTPPTPATGATAATPSGTPPTPATGATAATPSGTPPTPATGAT